MTLHATLSRYFARRFIAATAIVFMGLASLVLIVDYLELMRRAASNPNASALLAAQTSLYRTPHIVEQLIPFCVLVGAMVSYLALSRSMELVVARAAGISAWQFIRPAAVAALLLGCFAAFAYNPLSASLQEQAAPMEIEVLGWHEDGSSLGFWFSQATDEGTAMIRAGSSQDQGRKLSDVTIIRLDRNGRFQERIEARHATLEPGYWALRETRTFSLDAPPVTRASAQIKTNLSQTQVRESTSRPDTVSFWRLPEYIASTERAGLATAGYKYQYHKLLAKPFMLVAMVFLAAAVSLRFFRFGGVQKMVLSGVGAGFLLYVLSKITEDLSAAELMHPIAAAWLPVCIGGLTGFMALLYQEDG